MMLYIQYRNIFDSELVLINENLMIFKYLQIYLLFLLSIIF